MLCLWFLRVMTITLSVQNIEFVSASVLFMPSGRLPLSMMSFVFMRSMSVVTMSMCCGVLRFSNYVYSGMSM